MSSYSSRVESLFPPLLGTRSPDGWYLPLRRLVPTYCQPTHMPTIPGALVSWALFAVVPQEDILKAAYWSSPNSFIAYYLRDIPAAEPDFSRAALSAAARISAPTS